MESFVKLEFAAKIMYAKPHFQNIVSLLLGHFANGPSTSMGIAEEDSAVIQDQKTADTKENLFVRRVKEHPVNGDFTKQRKINCVQEESVVREEDASILQKKYVQLLHLNLKNGFL